MGAFSAKRLVTTGLLKELGNMRGLDMNKAEPAIVNGTREVVSGLVMTGKYPLLQYKYWSLRIVVHDRDGAV